MKKKNKAMHILLDVLIFGTIFSGVSYVTSGLVNGFKETNNSIKNIFGSKHKLINIKEGDSLIGKTIYVDSLGLYNDLIENNAIEYSSSGTNYVFNVPVLTGQFEESYTSDGSFQLFFDSEKKLSYISFGFSGYSSINVIQYSFYDLDNKLHLNDLTLTINVGDEFIKSNPTDKHYFSDIIVKELSSYYNDNIYIVEKWLDY